MTGTSIAQEVLEHFENLFKLSGMNDEEIMAYIEDKKRSLRYVDPTFFLEYSPKDAPDHMSVRIREDFEDRDSMRQRKNELEAEGHTYINLWKTQYVCFDGPEWGQERSSPDADE